MLCINVTLETSQLFIELMPPLLKSKALVNIYPIFVTFETSQIPIF